MTMIAADPSEERKPNQKEGEPMADEETANESSVLEAPDQPSVLDHGAMKAAYSSKESNIPN